ncbi:hypothetical protein LIER_11343 [Lithospermum erythrorhizon]|uniref:Integrase catalytic domain-containing protein n=1 Tax=Lithospermum erythrorhizon TaxID=34254 RepID=A0AAV3PMR4_LITER
MVSRGRIPDEGGMDNVSEGDGGLPEPWCHAIIDFLRTGDPPVTNKIQRQSLRYTLLDGVLSGPTVEVRHPRGRADGGRRDAWGHVRKPHQRKIPNAEDPMVRNILAICSQGCRTMYGGGKRYTIVGVDYFTKWVEAKPLIRQDQEQIYQFLMEIVTRFGVPWVLVADNGTLFTVGKIEDLCLELDIEHRTASMSYPQSNGQELPTVLWSFWTTSNPITRETPFSLVYGSDALLPVEIHLETAGVSYYDEVANEQGLRLNLDLLEEKRAAVVDKKARYKGKVATHYNKRVWARQFLVGDLVLRARQASAHGKGCSVVQPPRWVPLPILLSKVGSVGLMSWKFKTKSDRTAAPMRRHLKGLSWR